MKFVKQTVFAISIVAFMPTAGFAFPAVGQKAEQVRSIELQLVARDAAGNRGGRVDARRKARQERRKARQDRRKSNRLPITLD